MAHDDISFRTLLVRTWPHELAMPRATLESHGIITRTLNEHTALVNPFYSNAIGGVELQVSDDDFEKAASLLLTGGYL